MQLLNIPFSFICSSFLLFATSAIPVSSTELTQDTFDSTVAKGLWFIEHFSPWCGHCKHFKPTWEQLVAEAKTEIPTVNMATVDCVAYGDLCAKNNVEGYPTLLMFEDGKIVDKFKGSRELDSLKTFMNKHVKDEPLPEPQVTVEPTSEKQVPSSPTPRPVLNSAGEVLSLTSDTFTEALDKGPAFVKFFAPWCGHCKKLAPIWKQLARHMQGKVTVAEVNCDDNSSLCKAHGIQGYPTLVWFGQGNNVNGRSEYNSGRKFDQLAAFAEKASAAGVEILEKTEDLKAHVVEKNVLYLLLHSESDTGVIDMMRVASAPLLGEPRILASSDTALRAQFGIPAASDWVLLVIKDHDIRHPASTFYGTVTTSSTDSKLQKWLMTHRLPTTLELTRDTFQNVMNAPQGPLVVISAGPLALKEKIMERLQDVGAQWRTKTDGSGIVHGREVIFAWMDSREWAEWIKSMYGIKDADIVVDGEDELSGVQVVIADHSRLIYYDTDRDGRTIEFTSTASIFGAISDASAGNSPYKHSESFIERMARSLNNKMLSLENFIFNKPAQALLLFVGIAVGVVYVLSRLLGGDVMTAQQGQAEWIQNKGKNGRLD